MTRLDPTIWLSRLVVLKAGKAVYDQRFHCGVNIIHGENGSGKSTIADFIFFALGGEHTNWRRKASLCDFTLAEVCINGTFVTLRREVLEIGQRPMGIFWGTLDDGQSSPIDTWNIYPFRSSANKESFSQVLFRSLGMPEVIRDDLDSRITMHQMLRLVYVDQKTQYDKLFRDDNFDAFVTRNAVGDLLVGTYDAELYKLELRKRETRNEITQLTAELNGIGTVLREADESLTVSMLRDSMEAARSERDEVLERLRARDSRTTEEVAASLAAQVNGIAAGLVESKQEVSELAGKLENVDFELADSDDFMEALRFRLDALDDSTRTRTMLGSASFSFCPLCLNPVDDELEDACALCRQPIADRDGANVLRLRNELSMQIKESQKLQEERLDRRTTLAQRLSEATVLRDQRQRELDELSAGFTSSSEAERAALHRKAGYLDREIEDLARKIRLAARVEELESRRAEKKTLFERLEDEIAGRRRVQQTRRDAATTRISQLTTTLLKQDLPREVAFQDAEAVAFDFGKDALTVDGHANFAASSMVYLKNSFHVALLQASLELDYFRYPRFALIDNVEDKGMEPPRSHNFQSLVVSVSEALEVEHQVIMTTSMLNPDLDSDAWVIGPRYTHESRTLQF
ncbi:MAG: hypothetical protein OXH49_08480 [Gemmatimonadetes bacterium]|nr:hypothetical protein [Gemmatimonadota bacterium]